MPQQAKRFDEVKAIVDQVHYRDRMIRLIHRKFEDGQDAFYVQVQYYEEEIHTGKRELQSARKWYVSPFSTETEIVETVFKAVRTSNEHRLKENFTYKGRRVYSPHFDIAGRIALCDEDRFDGRIPLETPAKK